ncbi:hypothetical protein EVAR_65496_1 [Eumeta japonica]|uniref:Uncharacterized protein n=1 Tax=Eumeta variegata TaxID=151549 RepID=A0A4C2A6M3_EUMVA|nr:hypothetical protein EVAR_65496_1 [Eumeta japonica]
MEFHIPDMNLGIAYGWTTATLKRNPTCVPHGLGVATCYAVRIEPLNYGRGLRRPTRWIVINRRPSLQSAGFRHPADFLGYCSPPPPEQSSQISAPKCSLQTLIIPTLREVPKHRTECLVYVRFPVHSKPINFMSET